MTFMEYQKETGATAIYPKEKALEYLALGLTSEAGEVAGKVKKLIRDKKGIMNDADAAAIRAELGDVLWYISELCNLMEMPMHLVAAANLKKLDARKHNNTISGDGDNR
ncbi:MAG: nucleoside triphosphate pyrophosphohydrolase family protein [Parvularculaceae bacterium]|nr:nucleoside triphosphate pyrophosphohydrolase family protein [Parvularculaceae bacterium]